MKYTKYLNDTNPRVSSDMGNYGVMELQLFPSVAPITVENFLKLVEEKFYDGLIFHRVIKDFLIQGGDPTGTGMGGSKEKIKGEFMQNGVKNTLEHTTAVISMARSQNPNSASSQFFICHVNTPHLDGGYAAFGVVVEGLETVDKIANVKTDGRDKPVEDVRIKSITRVR
jgi:peptidyl-prolyl cis-trans isomerase B (cyclophilin B)